MPSYNKIKYYSEALPSTPQNHHETRSASLRWANHNSVRVRFLQEALVRLVTLTAHIEILT